MAPARMRGMLNIGFQQMVTFGILAANLINYGIDKIAAGFCPCFDNDNWVYFPTGHPTP
ncbi:hypothetical protein ZOSMA_103G00600 [Zostera marina]|uniref:Uncharacterized protein n=1 Tax=Zostera marina TaxID=29655 RepID=A0A0K9Q591_ZOSMR|nr:hypothetical protein ZOSMA_103G00600 [Zostera marina]